MSSIPLPLIQRAVHRLDATGVPLGRLATQIVTFLRGKHKPTFVHHLDRGDSVVIINAAQIKLTGQKLDAKQYHWHTGYLGNLKTRTARQFMERRPVSSRGQGGPAELIVRAVTGMLPKNRLRPEFLKRLTIYPELDPGAKE